MLDRQPILQSPDPEPGVIKVDVVTPEVDRLTDSQAMTIHRENQKMIADTVSSRLGGFEQGGDFGLAQKILASLMGVGGGCRATFYILPVERCCLPHRNPADFLTRMVALFTVCRFCKKLAARAATPE